MIDKDLFETKANGYKVENGKLVYFSNMLDGYRHEFKDLQEICEEMNMCSKQFDSLMSQLEYWRCEANTYKLWKDKLVEDFKQVRKETAEKIFAMLQGIGTLHTEFDWNDYLQIDVDDFYKVAKEFGVDLGE